jgi:hypothetical protein
MATLVEELLNQLDESDQISLFFEFCTNDRETFTELEIIDEVLFTDEVSGTIHCTILGDVYMGCRDLNHSPTHDVEVDFSIDLLESKIEFCTNPPDLQDRDPDDI